MSSIWLKRLPEYDIVLKEKKKEGNKKEQ